MRSVFSRPASERLLIGGETLARERTVRSNQPQLDVGDIYYEASCYLNGRPWDIDSEPRLTKEEAEQDATDWRSWLSKNEKKHATTHVNKYRVTAIDDDGMISGAISIEGS